MIMIIFSIVLLFAFICAYWRCQWWRRKWEKENEFANRLCVEEYRSHTYGLRLYNAMRKISHELGIPQPGYAAPVANAADIALKTLEKVGLPLCYLYNSPESANVCRKKE